VNRKEEVEKEEVEKKQEEVEKEHDEDLGGKSGLFAFLKDSCFL